MHERYRDLQLMPLAGEWREGSSERTRDVQNPYDQSTLLTLCQADRNDMDAAYRKAKEVQPEWAAMGPAARAEVMLRAVGILDARRDEIADWLIREAGSTYIKAQLEIDLVRAVTLEAASLPSRVHGRILPSEIPGKESRVYREPLGVVGVISPWNFPLQLSQRSVAPALAVGNAVVIKPASDTPLTGGLLLARIFEEAGLPAGVLSVVVGPGSEIGDAFVEHPIPKLISFTGSTPVGKNLGKLANGGDCIKHVALELGGNGPLVVLDDADIDQAVDGAIAGKFLHQGQVCMAVNRIIAANACHDAFVERFVERARQLPVGDPRQEDTVIGPIINAKQLDSLRDKIETAKREGAKVLLDGEIRGQIVPPHVFGDVTQDMNIASEEIFGPLVGILRARDEEHALALANDTEYGLSSAVYTRNLERGVRFARRMEAGMTHVNDMATNDSPNAPFGGEKNSGIGRFNGDWAIEEFTTDHWITVQHEPRRYPF
ncbi:aldehyde dehydrogenase family protein [Halomonas sp. McH1-25]|uniref:aldehyde dehydrogenase family protein n=1 Tax=unclassified Halomonas TaxID=2609666 RepID=UPI001EF45CD5|nr:MULTISPECIES: aldehyde dehydrogenase family protein [unclassified Halomonas]MCG7598218.1 aldehyde dehydrogenase family protein [Halomonas sp. McH1-25]MCP1340999.1 aldehyde dehydrogenase family protein [Halomonas sp. FL8]